MTVSQSHREDLVLRHVKAENDRDLDAIMATFSYPRYEIVPTAAVYDGDSEVRAMILAQWEQLPQLRFDAVALYHGSQGLVVETRTTCQGTSIDMLSVNVFVFDDDRLILERCYFDRMLFAAELGKASP